MELRNIHFQSAEDATAPTAEAVAEAAAPALGDTLRVRKVAVSPAEEYQLRNGEVQPISTALAAMILSRKGRVEIGPKGVVIDRADIGGKRYYWHADSPACNDMSYRTRKLWYVLNAQMPDVVHLLDDQGRYLETLPEKFQPGVLNLEEQAKELAAHKRQIGRMAEHLQRQHGKEAAATLEAARENNKHMQRVVRTLDAEAPAAEVKPLSTPTADRLRNGASGIRAAAQRRKAAAGFGRAVSAEVGLNTPRHQASAPAEDWSNSRHQEPVAAAAEEWSAPSHSPTQPTQPEAW